LATEPIGLRERKKQRTRDALARAALELFTTQGYEETTVDEIADAVDVSQRTFFRYFASKEEAAFSVQDLMQSHFLAHLLARPADEGPMEALRNAMATGWDTIDEAIREIVPVDLHMRTYFMIESTPALLAAHVRRNLAVTERIVRVIAEREGVDPETDPRPWVVVAAFEGVIRVAGWRWSLGDDQRPKAVRDLMARHLELLEPALAGRWRVDPVPGAGRD
jgi:AcrR family transcriptional regulator